MGEQAPSRHRRRERRRHQAAPIVEPATPPAPGATPATGLPAHPVEATPAGGVPAPPVEATPATGLPAPPAHPVEATPAVGVPAHPVEAGVPAQPVEDPGTAAEAAPKRRARPRRADAEHNLRGIVGAGSSQVGVVGAMRARDAAKPTAEDIAAAERDVVVIRRHYVPPDALPGAR